MEGQVTVVGRCVWDLACEVNGLLRGRGSRGALAVSEGHETAPFSPSPGALPLVGPPPEEGLTPPPTGTRTTKQERGTSC